MMLRTLGVVAALLLTTSLSHAAAFDPQAVAAQLKSDGYTSIEIKVGDNIAKVEAIKGTTRIEVTYDIASGDVIKSETQSAGDSGGSVPEDQPGIDDNTAADGQDDGVGHDVGDDNGNDANGGDDDGPNHDANDDHGGTDDGSTGSVDSSDGSDSGDDHSGSGHSGDDGSDNSGHGGGDD